MSISIGSNIVAGRLQRQLDGATSAFARSSERLASGQRINRASDDPAGLSISSSLGAAARVYTQGVRNINDAISALSIAEGGLDQQQSIVIRLRELTFSAASGTFGRTQRLSLNDEAEALANEFNRIGATSSFNGRALLDGTLDGLTIQFGFGSNELLTARVGDALRRNVGTGSFTQGAFVSTPDDDITGDVNNDGRTDLISTGGAIRFGQSDGTFSVGASWGGTGARIAVGDLNGDGNLDVVAGSGTSYTIRMGDGQGGFSAGGSFTGINPFDFEIGDLNNDGRDEIVAMNSSGVSVYTRSLAGVVTTASTLSSSSGGILGAVYLYDFGGDGNLDVGFASNSSGLRISSGNGQFGLSSAVSATASGGSISGFGASFADINQDGFIDYANSAGVRLGQGNGVFGPITQALTGFGSLNPYFGDFNGDGVVDLFSYDDGDVNSKIYFGNGDGSFRLISDTVQTTLGGALLGDFNGDGVLDFLDDDTFDTYRLNLGDKATTTMIAQINLSTRATALEAIDALDAVFARLISERGVIGAAQSRLGSALRTSDQTVLNYLAAQGRLQDLDIAGETAAATATSIRQQAAAALLGQATLAPRIALDLLRAA